MPRGSQGKLLKKLEKMGKTEDDHNRLKGDADYSPNFGASKDPKNFKDTHSKAFAQKNTEHRARNVNKTQYSY